MRYAALTGGGRAPLVSPGTYQVSVTKRVKDEVTPLGEPRSFEVVTIGDPNLPVQDREDIRRFQTRAAELQRAVSGTSEKLQEVLDQLDSIKNVIRRSRKADEALFEEARGLELKLTTERELLNGDSTRTSRGHTAPPSILRRARNAYSGSMSDYYGPTKTHRREYEIARQEYKEVAKRLKKLIEEDFGSLQEKLDKAGLPWTAGRQIPQLKN